MGFGPKTFHKFEILVPDRGWNLELVNWVSIFKLKKSVSLKSEIWVFCLCGPFSLEFQTISMEGVRIKKKLDKKRSVPGEGRGLHSARFRFGISKICEPERCLPKKKPNAAFWKKLNLGKNLRRKRLQI